MNDEIVVLRRADLEVIMEGVVGRVLQGLALSLSGGAAAAAAFAGPQKTRTTISAVRPLELAAGTGKPTKKAKGKRDQGSAAGRVIVDVDEPGDWIGLEDAARLAGYSSSAALFYQANKGALRVKQVPSDGGKGSSHRTLFDKAEIMALKRAKNGGLAPRTAKQQLPLPEVAPEAAPQAIGWTDTATASKVSKLSVPTLLRAATAGTVTARRPAGNARLWEFKLDSVLAAVRDGKIVPRKKRKKQK